MTYGEEVKAKKNLGLSKSFPSTVVGPLSKMRQDGDERRGGEGGEIIKTPGDTSVAR